MAKRPTLAYDGLADLRDMLTNIAPKEANKIAGDTVFSVAKRVEGRIFRRLQSTSRTGRLAHSIFTRKKRPQYGEHAAEVRGGATAPYMLMQEFGTSRTKANPAIVPSVEETRPELAQIYREEFAENLAKSLKRLAKKK